MNANANAGPSNHHTCVQALASGTARHYSDGAANIRRDALLALVACLACLGPLAAQAPAVIDAAPASGARIEAVAARHGMVVAQETRAARIGVEILEQGGNAVDAAVATGLALAVTYPRAGNIGGGGYMLIHFAGGKGD